MSRFRRSSHYRTNSSGTTFLVREHDVARDEWDVTAPRTPSPAVAFSAAALSERGTIYPNARCPICMDRVYFFKASNGGRVFFNTLWPDWDKHPCTISETSDVMDATPRTGEAETEEVGSLEIEVYVRIEEAILALIDQKGHREYLSGNIDLSQRYFQQAWRELNQEKPTGVLTLLDENMAPVGIPVAPASEPPPLTDRIRITLSSRMKGGLIRTAKRVVGMSKSFLQTKSGYGTYVAGLVGDSRVIVIPIPADHARWDYNSFDIVGEYMATIAAKVSDLLDENPALKSKRPMQDHVIFAFDDPFGYVQDGMMNEVLGRVDGAIPVDAFSYDGKWTLEKAGIKNLHWADMAHAEPIEITEKPATVADVVAREDAFCGKQWPGKVAGRWRQIEMFAELVGVSDLFGVAHRALREAGWALDHGEYFEVIYHFTGTSEGQSQNWHSVRWLLSLSNVENGLCFLRDPDKPEVHADARLSWVKNASDAVRLVQLLKMSD